MLCPFEGKLPDHNLFQGHAPAKIDARRAALNEYFDLLLESPLTERAALAMCAFFSADAIGPDLEEQDVGTSAKKSSIAATVRPNSRSHREGYLTKRGKNFGGWKARYFILDGPELRYYDSQGGPQIGVIKLYSAQIGKQSAHASNESPVRDADENQYRHAFLILEPKRKDSSSLVRHVLCAESDEERDAWVRACMAYVDYQEEKPRSSTSSKQLSGSSPASTLSRLTSTPPHSTPVVSHQPDRLRDERSLEVEPPTSSHNSNKENEPVGTKSMSTVARRRNESPQAESAQTLGVSYEETVQAEAPIIGPTSYHNRGLPSPNLTGSFPRGHPLHSAAISGKEFSISAPMDGGRIQDAAMWGMKTPTPAKEKKRSIFGFRGRSSSDLNIHPAGATFSSEGTERREPPRNVFGMPLLEAIECSQPLGVDDYLPAVVYRSLEYLRARDAVIEEGIFRLSGSNTTIKALRERFNTEGDVKLLEEEYYDVHAVASLLKLYLRELPTSILTRDRHLDFLKVLELDDKPKKIASFNVLVHQLPAANYALLQALCAFLIEVINNSDLNKMNVRNG
jgi:RalA-binding protein 1